MSSDSPDRGGTAERRSTLTTEHSFIVPLLQVNQRIAGLAASSQSLQVVKMAPRRNSLTSDLEDSTYDLLSVSDVISDDDACTDSLSGSTMGDESEGNTASEFRYDSDGSVSDEEEEIIIVRDGERDGATQATPSIGPRPDDHESLEDKLLGSHLSELTVRPSKTEQSILFEEAEKKRAEEDEASLWGKLKSHEAFEQTMHALESPIGQKILKLSVVVAAALVTSRVVSPWVAQQDANNLVPYIPQQKANAAANIQHLKPNTQYERKEPAQAKNWPQFEQLQHTLDFLKELTSSQLAQSSSVASVKSKSPSTSSSSATSSVTMAAAKPSPAFSKKQNRTRSKVVDKVRYTKDEKFYVFLNTGRVTPFSVGHKLKHKHRFGPFTQVTGDDKKFKVEFDSQEGKFKVAHVGAEKFRGSTRVVVSRNGQVLQRGQLNSPDATITWIPSRIKPAQRFGQVQVLFALPTEAVFQVSVLDLGDSPVLQWTSPPKKAAAAATDVMRRITDAINVYVEPHRHFIPLMSPWQKPKDADNNEEPHPVPSQVTDVIFRAQKHAVAIAQSFRTVALMDIEAANRCLVQANTNLVKTFTKYRGEVIRAARGAPRRSLSLSKAQDRVKELKRTMKKKLAGQKNEPIGRVKKEEKETKPVISPWGILGM
jgi:hypothetical protein